MTKEDVNQERLDLAKGMVIRAIGTQFLNNL
jgi:hypothetical protein